MCLLCNKENIKHLSNHLDSLHKLTTHKDRAPFLKCSLKMQKMKEAVKKDDAVKHADTVLEEKVNAADERMNTTAEFRKQERTLSANFQKMEDSILAIRLKATTVHSAMSVERIKLDVREYLVPLFQMVMKALATMVCDTEPPAQLKRKHNNQPRAVKRKKKQAVDTDVLDTSSDVRNSAGKLFFLENGLVRYQLCLFTWDGNAQHECFPDDA